MKLEAKIVITGTEYTVDVAMLGVGILMVGIGIVGIAVGFGG